MTVLLRARATLLALALAATPLLLADCAGHKKDEYVEKPVDQLYNEAMDALEQRDYEKATKDFDEVDRQHPNSPWATKAQLMSAYSQYEGDKQDEAVAALDRFIQLHPGYKDIAYAYYLKALCYYEQIADVQRDQKITEEAQTALLEVVTRFPATKYARDAQFKLDLVHDHLAGREMSIGRFYQFRKQYVAAINRYLTVITKYQTTNQVPEALERLVECYETLGLGEEGRKWAAYLGYNYPGDRWYADSYELVKSLPGGQSVAAAPPPGPAPAQPAASGGGWFGWLDHLW